MNEHVATAIATEEYRQLPIDQVVESTQNPRKHFAADRLNELAASIREKGVIEPLVVRPNGTAHSFEIVAGARRFRAARAAGLTTVPAVIRAYSDEQVLELMLVENIQRTDLSPLDQARGYRALIDANPTKHSAESIATRIGMSPAWVWDRLKLNDLVREAKVLLEQERMTVGHAILIARQTPANQTRIINPAADALFTPVIHGLQFDGDRDPKEKPGKYDDVKPVSVRELEAWIARHIRFDVAHAAKAQPLQFETTADVIEQAQAQPGRGKKVIAITHEYRVADDARDDAERTYGGQFWERADGQAKSKTCEHSLLGVVVAGPGYGETLQVCVARDRCRVHFGQVLAAREKAAAKPRRAAKRADIEADIETARQQREEADRQEKARQWNAFLPAVKKATLAAVEKTPTTLPTPLFAAVLKHLNLPANTSPGGLPHALLERLVRIVFERAYSHYQKPDVVALATLLGVDVKACEPAAPTTGASTKKSAKPAKGKKGKAA